MDFEVLSLVILSSLALFAAAGGAMSYQKHRQPLEGFILGAVLGPIGLVLVHRMPYAHRPMVDRGAWHSFRSVVDYQSKPTLLQLPAPTSDQAKRR